MKFTNKKLLIFDLDGTLINSVPDLANAVNFTLKTLNKNTFQEETIVKWIGNGAEILIQRALSSSVEINSKLDIQTTKKALKIFLEFYDKNVCVETTIYNGVKKTLEKLKKNGYILAIVTNKPFKFIKPILDFFDIENLFKCYIGADSLKYRKPHPMPLLHICQKFNISVKEAIMIGDSKNDILAARNARMDSIGVNYGYNYYENISLYNPTFVIDKFENILL